MLSRYMFMAMVALTVVLAFITIWMLTRNWRPRDRYGYMD